MINKIVTPALWCAFTFFCKIQIQGGNELDIIGKIRNYFFYCGIEKDEYNALKKDAYISNFKVWRILHVLMAAAFGILFLSSFFVSAMAVNRSFYLTAFVYSGIAIVCFFLLKKDSIIAQFFIYLSISVLFVFGCMLAQNKPDYPSVTFIAILLVAPMFMIDKPFFMTIELCAATAVFLIWMHGIKTPEAWQVDLLNVIPFTIIGCFLNVIANSIRIKEFVLTRQIRIQKDTDELTGISNKGALTRDINAYLNDRTTDKGIMLLLDCDHFKSINDTYGHDVGDSVILQIGQFLGKLVNNDVIAGRFGGDEFVVFIKGTNDLNTARKFADEIANGISANVQLPEKDKKITISIGISFYKGLAKNYSEIFNRSDMAMYKAKADPNNRYCIFDESES